MDKQEIKTKLLDKLNELRTLTFMQYGEYTKGSIEAPGAMQSHSDTSKFQFGRLADDLFKKLQKLDKVIGLIQQLGTKKTDNIQIGSAVLVDENGKTICFYIVPDGAGGQNLIIEDAAIQTISENSIIGNALVNKKSGQTVELLAPAGARRIKILDIW